MLPLPLPLWRCHPRGGAAAAIAPTSGAATAMAGPRAACRQRRLLLVLLLVDLLVPAPLTRCRQRLLSIPSSRHALILAVPLLVTIL
jgi:hypothetical protein